MALLTANDIKTELSMESGDTDYDTLLGLMASAVQSVFDELTDRTFESAVFTEYYSGRNKQEKVFLKNYPIISITSIHDDSDRVYGSDTLISSDDYTYDSDTGIVYIEGGVFKGFNNIKIVYTAGFTANTFPNALKQVWIRQCCHWYKDAKDSDWARESTSRGGDTINKKKLISNLLPDFWLFVERNKR